MKIEDFIILFGGNPVTPIINEQKEYAQKVKAVIDKKMEAYVGSLKKDANDEPEIGLKESMIMTQLQTDLQLSAFTHLESLHVNPLTFFIPDVFLQDQNNLETLQDFGNAYDKTLLVHWRYFRQFFIHKRKFMFSTQEYMSKLLAATEVEKVLGLCHYCKDFVENYDSIDSLLKYKDTGAYYSSKVQSEMTHLTEFITQCLDRQDVPTIQVSLQMIYQRLQLLPQIVYDVAIGCIYYVTALLDIDRCDFNNDMIEFSLETPKAVISQLHDPMKSEAFRMQGRTDAAVAQGKVSQYNVLIDQFPVWNILEDTRSQLRYINYHVNTEKRQHQIDEVNKMIEEIVRKEKAQKEATKEAQKENDSE